MSGRQLRQPHRFQPRRRRPQRRRHAAGEEPTSRRRISMRSGAPVAPRSRRRLAAARRSCRVSTPQRRMSSSAATSRSTPGGDPNSVFIFQAKTGTLKTAAGTTSGIPNTRVLLTNGAQACNVYWQVGSSATIETFTQFVGTVLADQSITVNTGATIVNGRALARNGAVTLDTNTITAAPCSTTPTSSGGGSSGGASSGGGSAAAARRHPGRAPSRARPALRPATARQRPSSAGSATAAGSQRSGHAVRSRCRSPAGTSRRSSSTSTADVARPSVQRRVASASR